MRIRCGSFRISRTVLFVFVATLSLLPGTRAQTEKGSATSDQEKLEQKIKQDIIEQLPQEIIKVLLRQNFLNHEIEIGIGNYVKKQQQARVSALEKQEQIEKEKAKDVSRLGSRDHIYGNPNAPVSLIEYADFECPFCKQFDPTPKQIVDAYGGRVNWVYRHFPLSMHNPGAEREAKASECAASIGGNGAFWKYADAIYARTQSNGAGFPASELTPLAKEIGLDEKQFAACMESDRPAVRVREDIDEGTKIGILATPTTIILDNRTGVVILQSGAVPVKALRAEIDKLLGDKHAAGTNSALQ